MSNDMILMLSPMKGSSPHKKNSQPIKHPPQTYKEKNKKNKNCM